MEMGNKIKIAIVTRKMVMGGIEKSLITLITELQKIDAEITLYLESTGGELFDEIPEGTNVVDIFENKCNSVDLIKKLCKRKKFGKAVYVVLAYIYNKLGLDPVQAWKYTCKYLDIQREEYDYVFSYGAPVAFSMVFADCNLKAAKKYTWIHNVIDNITLDAKKYSYLFKPFDKIVCVSKEAERIFDIMLPEYAKHSMIFYNYLNREEILNRAEELIDYGYEGTKIVTIGRMCYEKGQDIIPEITRKLNEDGYIFKWYCIGDGESWQSVKNKIEAFGLSEKIILLGNQNNPYPYLKAADIYCQPSRSEGFGITISEAKIFDLPIVATDFAGASEQLTDRETGLIVKFDIDDIYHALKAILDDADMAERFKINLKNDRKSCISKLAELISVEQREGE